MTNLIEANAVTQEQRDLAAAVGSRCGELYEYLRQLAYGNPTVASARCINIAMQRVEEAAMWAIKGVVDYGQ